MSSNRLTGTSWHVERLHRSEDDQRRYKGRCRYYRYEDKYCKARYGRCSGSAHCPNYVALSDNEFKQKQKEEQLRKKR